MRMAMRRTMPIGSRGRGAGRGRSGLLLVLPALCLGALSGCLGTAERGESIDIGDVERPITTDSAVAQQWFDRGLAWTFGFNHAEAIHCYEQAIAADPGCAMAWWGVSYASGPHINNMAMDEASSKRAHDALERALALAPAAAPVERALIEALRVRYAWPAPADRAPLEKAYAAEMRKVAAAFPDDRDVLALFVESLMDLKPWQYWDSEGNPAPETPEIVATIEKGLARWPDHAGLCHFYIHAVEASPEPRRAKAAADRLRTLVPAVGHLVHMPSHIDVLLGDYELAVEANRRGVAADNALVERRGPTGFYTLYRLHNYHFITYAAMFDGRYEVALDAARGAVGEISDEALVEMIDFLDGFVATPYHVLVRFGRWDAILAEPEPKAELFGTRGLRHYARGVAYSALGDTKSARDELAKFREVRPQLPKERYLFQNRLSDILAIAGAMLEGEILYREGKIEDSFAILRGAVALDDGLSYDEPWGWMQPVRHALGALLVEQGRFEEAEAIYEEDLRSHPDNGWALHGLAACRRARGDAAGATEAEKRFEKAWARADVEIEASCFCAGRRGGSAGTQ
jgi:tetratricopeptide (TPR) repeat protein